MVVGWTSGAGGRSNIPESTKPGLEESTLEKQLSCVAVDCVGIFSNDFPYVRFYLLLAQFSKSSVATGLQGLPASQAMTNPFVRVDIYRSDIAPGCKVR